MASDTSLIITSIAAPNIAMKAFAKGCQKNNIEFIVIGDKKSPKKFSLKGCRFVSFQEQRRLPFKLAKLLPENHYSRKNIGYLLSKDKDVIIETDDDNIPKENFWRSGLRSEGRGLRFVANNKGWINVYSFFTKESIWPRGFPLEHLGLTSSIKSQTSSTKTQASNLKIIQGLADENPDVDAIYRLSYSLPQYFEEDNAVVLGKNTWCPFNSQNTTWFKEAFPLMYLPSYCSFRMTDIWRSFIAQRITWECGWMIAFESPTVTQKRNKHNLIKDFEDEVPGYLYNDRIRKVLENQSLKKGEKNILENLKRCYQLMIDKKWMDNREMKLVDAWCEEFEFLNKKSEQKAII